MAHIYASMEELIGETPLLELRRMEELYGLKARLLGKMECMNPAGSAKDRVAMAMLDEAEASGRLAPGGTVIEPTSGNTGIGLCAVAAVRGYHAIIVMPDTMSVERIRLMRAYGAEVVLSPGAEGMKGAIEKAEALAASIPGSFIPGQFDNPANPSAHYRTTGREIWADTDGEIDIFVAGVGTGGTISGAGKFLREMNPDIHIIAVEPKSSPLLSAGRAGSHGLQGIGANFVPEVLDRSLMDEIIPVTDADAYRVGRELAQCEGLLCGITAGAAVWAAMALASRPENAGACIVALLPDLGDRYLSSPMFE